MYKIVNIENKQAWHEWRQQGIGGSDFAVLLDQNPYMNVNELWQVKCGYSDGQKFTNETIEDAQQIGKQLESSIIDDIIDIQKLTDIYDSSCIQNINHDFLKGSVDGIGQKHGKEVILEAKTMSKSQWEKHKCIPEMYKTQVKYYLMITGIEKGYIMMKVYDKVGSDDNNIEIKIIDTITAEITITEEEKLLYLGLAQQFWHYVETKQEPPESLRAVPLSDEENNLFGDYHLLSHTIKNAEKRKLEIKDYFVEKYGKKSNKFSYDNTILGQMIQTERSTFDFKALETDDPILYQMLKEKYTKHSNVTMFKVK